MKKKSVLLSLLAAWVFSGCSSDDLENEGNNNHNECGYVAVSIVQPQVTGGRTGGENGTARADSGFEEGTEEENKAEKGLFFIFNEAGTEIYGEPQSVDLTKDKPASTTPAAEKAYRTMLKVDDTKNTITDATKIQIVCVLNAPSNLISAFNASNNKRLSFLTDLIGDYGVSTSGKFIMTNTVYRDNNSSKVLGTVVTGNHVKRTTDEAQNAPVDVYVERVVAKVRIQTDSKFTEKAKKGFSAKVEGGTNSGTNGETTFSIRITGVGIANIAEKSYLFKNIDGIADTWKWVWDVNNKRSYWETVPPVLQAGETDTSNKLTFSNQSYRSFVTNSPKEGTTFDIDKLPRNKPFYIQPNTGSQKTAVLVTAELKDAAAKATDKPETLVYLRGSYYTEKKAQEKLVGYINLAGYRKREGTTNYTYKPLTSSDLGLTWKNREDDSTLGWLKSYEAIAQTPKKDKDLTIVKLKENGGDGFDTSSINDINNFLKGTEENSPYKARVYTDGKCYYFVNIDQSSVAGVTPHTYDYEGVVRNHIYNLTLRDIEGPGIPVFDSADTIIPEGVSEEKLFYLSARMDILSWKIVTQFVDFK